MYDEVFHISQLKKTQLIFIIHICGIFLFQLSYTLGSQYLTLKEKRKEKKNQLKSSDFQEL